MGLLFAQNFANLGGNVVLCDVNEDALNERVAELNAQRNGLANGAEAFGLQVESLEEEYKTAENYKKLFGEMQVEVMKLLPKKCFFLLKTVQTFVT